jgi:hypothetical protein
MPLSSAGSARLRLSWGCAEAESFVAPEAEHHSPHPSIFANSERHIACTRHGIARLPDGRNPRVSPHTALIVDPRPEEVAATASRLRELGCQSNVVCTFEEAKTRLSCSPELSLMIAAVRLREFNGVHLALRGRTLFPKARIVLTDYSFDPVIERETLKLGAEYVLKPLDASNVAALLAEYHPSRGAGGSRRWDRKMLPPAACAWLGNRTVRVLDVSYGGVRIEVPRDIAERLPHAVEIAMPVSGLAIRLRPIWATCAADADVGLCGAELLPTDEQLRDRWQDFVDAL